MKKITAVLLAIILVISLFALTSCEKEPKELLEEAAKVLAEKPYTMTMKMDFTSDNAEMNEVFKMMNMEFPITVDGDNLSFDMSMDVSGLSMTTKMTLVDKVLYYDISATGVSQKMKATLTDEQFTNFMGDQSMEMPVDYSQFAELTAEEKDGKTVITCTGISEEGKKALNDQMAASVESLGGSVELGDLAYSITLKDGKYESMDLSCTYTVSVSGITTTVTMTMGATISYDNVAEVTAPADADSYTEFDYSSLLGG